MTMLEAIDAVLSQYRQTQSPYDAHLVLLPAAQHRQLVRETWPGPAMSDQQFAKIWRRILLLHDNAICMLEPKANAMLIPSMRGPTAGQGLHFKSSMCEVQGGMICLVARKDDQTLHCLLQDDQPEDLLQSLSLDDSWTWRIEVLLY